MNSTSANHLKLYDDRAVNSAVVDKTLATTAAVDDLHLELQRTRRALRRCEAELAAGVPLVPQPQPQRHLAERLEAVLQGVAEALGCSAAAVYLLDAATTELKLRTAWNLPFERFLDAPRPLPSAVADIEALAGHAVVLEDVTNYGAWNLPEVACGAAVCVPVSSPTVPLGTLWLFAAEPREFSDQEVNVVEIGAGRIASDLEREMLMTETRDAARLRRSWDEAAGRRAARTPQIAPLCDEWEIAGRTLSVDGGFAEFFDWRTTADGALCAAVGAVEQTDFAAALDVTELRTTWRANVRHATDPARLLELVNDDLWSGSAETAASHVATICTDPHGALRLASAGRTAAAVFGDAKVERVDVAAAPLGVDPDVAYSAASVALEVGEVLVLADDERLVERLIAARRKIDAQSWSKLTPARILDRLVGLLGDDPLHGTLVAVRRKS